MVGGYNPFSHTEPLSLAPPVSFPFLSHIKSTIFAYTPLFLGFVPCFSSCRRWNFGSSLKQCRWPRIPLALCSFRDPRESGKMEDARPTYSLYTLYKKHFGDSPPPPPCELQIFFFDHVFFFKFPLSFSLLPPLEKGLSFENVRLFN